MSNFPTYSVEQMASSISVVKSSFLTKKKKVVRIDLTEILFEQRLEECEGVTAGKHSK